MTRIIKDWHELSKVPPNNKYKLEINLEDCCGHITTLDGEFMEYLSSHTFYGKTGTPYILKEYGWDIELDNWDKESDKNEKDSGI